MKLDEDGRASCLTYENDGRLIFLRNLEEHPDQLLPLPMPLTGQSGS